MELEDHDEWPIWPSEALLEDPDVCPGGALLEDPDVWPSEALLEDPDAWSGGAEDALDDKGDARGAQCDWTMFGMLRLGGSLDSGKAMIPKVCGGLK